MFELRAATSLASLWRDQGKGVAVRGLLAPSIAGFDTVPKRSLPSEHHGVHQCRDCGSAILRSSSGVHRRPWGTLGTSCLLTDLFLRVGCPLESRPYPRSYVGRQLGASE